MTGDATLTIMLPVGGFRRLAVRGGSVFRGTGRPGSQPRHRPHNGCRAV